MLAVVAARETGRERSTLRHWAACAALAGAVMACAQAIEIEGSSCATDSDCLVNPSCAYRDGACVCKSNTCWFDDGTGTGSDSGCRGCHGSLANAAPPLGLGGVTETAALGVGAHQAHLGGGAWSRPVACSECHVVPRTPEDAGHDDTPPPAELSFGALASTGGLTVLWERSTATCSGAYCHGATLAGGSVTAPVWTSDDGTQAACGACHGLPPGGDHPAATRCEICHSPTAGPDLTIANAATHVDGIVQGGQMTCGSCHGTADNPAPPPAVHGEVDTSLIAVGAHTAHTTDGALRLAVGCAECHVVPAGVGDPGHIDGTAALTFGPLASAGAAAPVWSSQSATCSSSYCHGATLDGGSDTTPVWTRVDGSQVTCGSCHGEPPPPPHPGATDCSTCHPGTVTPWGTIDTLGGLHIDGVVQVEGMTCTSCHGNPATGETAPPRGTHGELPTTDAAVGAHASHLAASNWHRQLPCGECHVIPTGLDHTDGVVQLPFAGVSTADGALPGYDAASGSCSNVYCHGTTLQGGASAARTPLWTQVDGTFNACGSACHTNPPGAPHVQVGQCATCHGAVVDPAGNIAAPELHVNGTVDLALPACGSCHGTPTAPAPPPSTTGSINTADVAVGAHASHLRDGAYRQAVACDECHQVPAAPSDPGHLDAAPAEILFGPLATAAGATPTWDRVSATCAGSFCHGATLAGGSNPSPHWTVVDGSEVGCGTCHGNPPPPPHSTATTCDLCHPGTVTPAGTIDVAGGLHIDGKVDSNGGNCTDCHGSGTEPAPPLGTQGESATTSRAVGAHREHLGASSWHRAGRCADCHQSPTSIEHSDLVVQLAFGSPADADGALPSYRTDLTCAGVYCHGATLQPAAAGQSALRTPSWTQVDGTFDACGSACHTNPPGGTHLPSTQCAACHAAVITAAGTFANPALHIDGTVQASTPTCHSCHGGVTNDAPPVSTTGATTTANVGVGAHQAHLVAGRLRSAMACDECHVVPAEFTSAGHLDAAPAEVTFGPLAATGGAAPGWQRTTATCAGSYCHGATLTGGTNQRPVWTRVDGSQAACGTCHGQPPPPPHPQLTQCQGCHPDTATATGGINIAGGHHINGVVEAVPMHPQPAWNTPGSGDYHGDAANAGLDACTPCHGANLDGGGVGSPCTDCHDPNWRTDCTLCHGGTDNTSGAPPADVSGLTATSLVTVGTHTSHLSARHTIASALACGSCHVVPADALSPGHIDAAPAELAFGTLARTGGASPTWNRATGSCSSTYCHGQFSGGTTTNVPQWTRTDGSAVACTACHGVAPNTGEHRLGEHRQEGCDQCHDTVTNAAGTAIVTPSSHVNGVKDVRLKQGGTWSASTRRCDPACHGQESW